MSSPTHDPHVVFLRGAVCKPAVTAEQVEKRGVLWIMGAFLICPCHLPLTLWLAATLLGGTALGAALWGHRVIAGAVITLVWLAATWRGFHLLRSARAYAARAKSRA
jgi:hypothetical protein